MRKSVPGFRCWSSGDRLFALATRSQGPGPATVEGQAHAKRVGMRLNVAQCVVSFPGVEHRRNIGVTTP